MSPRLFKRRNHKRNSGIPYLIVILLAAAVIAGAFRMDEGILLLPILGVGVAIVFVLSIKKFKSPT